MHGFRGFGGYAFARLPGSLSIPSWRKLSLHICLDSLAPSGESIAEMEAFWVSSFPCKLGLFMHEALAMTQVLNRDQKESRPRQARPEDCSIYIYIYIYVWVTFRYG